MDIRLLVGLGNPGKEYEKTRHNVGFMVIDELAKNLRLKNPQEVALSHVYKARLGGKEVYLAKPQTYMNNSGVAVYNLLEEFSLSPEQMIVVYDDLDLPLGSMRLRLRGSSGGHRGVESIIKAIGTQNFPRLRIGIGRPKKKEDVVKYVLSPFSPEEERVIGNVIKKATRCLTRAVELSPEHAMEYCNRQDVF
ncbi:MAG: aminoacyl-tRNA hydrolase, partial [Aquificae bacterium]|nr:aminoacyl-tRNA hydrolase [Aquificota bacterium]